MSPERKVANIGFDDVVRKAKETILLNGYHLPILMVCGSRNNFITHLTYIPETHNQRFTLFQDIGELVGRSRTLGQLRQVYLISWGWMSTRRDQEAPYFVPSEDPDRKDVLIVAGLDNAPQKKHLTIFEIIRDGGRRIVSLEQVEPSRKVEASAEVPLLEAFASGFQRVFQGQVN